MRNYDYEPSAELARSDMRILCLGRGYKKIIILLMLQFLILQMVACQPSAQELDACNQTIHEKLELTKPYSDWVQVLCTEEGHIIRPGNGYQWVAGGIEDIYLNKTGDVQKLVNGGPYKDGMSLRIAWGRLERVDYVIRNFNNFLQELNPDAPRYAIAHSLGFKGDMPFSYNFFILIENSDPQYMILCKEMCHFGKPILIKVQRLNE